jgi:U3 small nucleolar RNA-associated protein 22
MAGDLKRKREKAVAQQAVEVTDHSSAAENGDAMQDIVEGDTVAFAHTHIKKPPTGEELRAMKDAADLYQSSSFKLQVIFPSYHIHVYIC